MLYNYRRAVVLGFRAQLWSDLACIVKRFGYLPSSSIPERPLTAKDLVLFYSGYGLHNYNPQTITQRYQMEIDRIRTHVGESPQVIILNNYGRHYNLDGGSAVPLAEPHISNAIKYLQDCKDK